MYTAMSGGLCGRGGRGGDESRLDVLGETLRGDDGRARGQSDGAGSRGRDRQHGSPAGGDKNKRPAAKPGKESKEKVVESGPKDLQRKIVRKYLYCTASDRHVLEKVAVRIETSLIFDFLAPFRSHAVRIVEPRKALLRYLARDRRQIRGAINDRVTSRRISLRENCKNTLKLAKVAEIPHFFA
jgi:hypothetical protein